MYDRVRRIVFSLIIAMFLASGGLSTGVEPSGDGQRVANHNCPAGTHWDSAQGKCVSDR